ncbi:hypothetical protein ACIPRI_16015 [Variovorax sp. LARHSF232]
MATWSANARADWAAGMRSEQSNSLNGTAQVALRGKVETWADGAGQLLQSKLFPVGDRNGVKLGVKVTAQNAEVGSVRFGDLMTLGV